MLKRSQNKQHIRVETQDIRLTEEEEISQGSLVMVALPLVVLENEMIGTELNYKYKFKLLISTVVSHIDMSCIVREC